MREVFKFRCTSHIWESFLASIYCFYFQQGQIQQNDAAFIHRSWCYRLTARMIPTKPQSCQSPSPWTEPLSATDHKNCEKRVPCNHWLPCGLPFWDRGRTLAWWINSSGLVLSMVWSPPNLLWKHDMLWFHISKVYQSSLSHSKGRPCQANLLTWNAWPRKVFFPA